MKTRTIRGWAWVHTWSSLVCTAFLLMLCVTGLPLIFHDEINGWLHPATPLPPAPDRLLSLDTVLARGLAGRPGEVPLYVSFDTDRPVANVTSAPDADGAAMHFQSLDRRTGSILPTRGGGGVMAFLLRLHTDMFLALPGGLFLGAMGVLFAVALVSGIVIYAPYTAHMRFGTIRRERRPRVRWTDYHNLLGATTLAWATVVGLTGTINTLVVPMTDYWKSDQLAAFATAHAGGPVARAEASVQAAMDQAMAAAPGMRVQFIAFPGVAYSSDHHYAVFLQGATPLTEKLLTPVLIDARTGRLDAVLAMPWYMQALLLSQPLHFGDYGGLAMKLLWALLDIATIVVLGSGLYLWATRRRVRR